MWRHARLFTLALSVAATVGVSGAAQDRDRYLEGWGMPVDPDGKSKIAADGDGLTIDVPGGLYDLGAEVNKVYAPRVLAEVEGDFLAEVVVTSPPRPSG